MADLPPSFVPKKEEKKKPSLPASFVPAASAMSASFIPSEKPSLLSRAGSFAMKAITPFAGPERVLSEAAVAVEAADLLKLEAPSANDGPFGAAVKAVEGTVAGAAFPLSLMAKAGGPLSPSTVAAALSPTPLDVATLGIGGFAKALKAAGLVGKGFGGAARVGPAVEEVFKPVASLDEAIVRLEAAASKAPKQPSILIPVTQGPLPKEVIGANLARLNTTDDVKRFVADTAASNRMVIDDARRGSITHAETLRLANDLGMTSEDLLKRRKGVAFNAEEALASRQLLVVSAEDVQASAQAIASGKGTLSEFTAKMQRHISIQAQAGGVRAEAGRALSAFNIKAGGGLEKAIKLFLEQSGNKEITAEIAERIAKLDPLDPSSLNRFVRDSVEGTFGDKLMEAWINGLLSGPTTHIVNSVSNALTLISRPLLERPVRAAIDSVRSLATGTQRANFMGEVGADLMGIVRGVPEGVSSAIHAFQDGISSFGSGKMEDAVRTASAIKGPLGRVINIPGRALQAADEFFKTVVRSGEMSALAYKDAAKRGLKGQAMADHISSILTRSTEHAEDLWKTATTEAKYRTFTQPLGDIGQALQKIRRHSTVARVVVPFLNTPINVAKFGLERTPMNFARLVYKHGLKDLLTKPELVDELAKPVLGSLIAVPVVSMAADGRITGGGIRNPERRSVMRAAGWQPYSIKIGDKYYSYARIEPISIIVGLAADYVELDGIIDKQDAASKIALAISQNLTNKTFMRGISDLIKAVSEPERYGERWVTSLSGTLIPTGVASIARVNDPVLRRPQGFVEALQARTPGLSQDISPMRDIWGEEIALPGSAAQKLLSPVYISKISQDKATLEIDRLKMDVQTPRMRLGKVELSKQELDFFIETAGKKAKILVDELINRGTYKNMTDFEREFEIDKAFSAARKEASDILGVPKRRAELAKAEALKRIK